jgi:2-haloalkanoic acid dehalogenase type II
MMPKLRGIFFDLDDTLIDYSEAEQAALDAGCRVAARHYPAIRPVMLATAIYDVYQSRYAYGLPGFTDLATLTVVELRRRLTSEALEHLGIHDADLVETLLQVYAEAERETLRPFPEVRETLARLRPYFYLGVITNGPSAMQREKLAAMALEGAFDAIIVDTEFGHSKPDPRIFHHAAHQAGRAADELLFVGNSLEYDVAGARAAGWTSVWLTGTAERPRPEALRPDFVIRAIPEVTDLPPVRAVMEPENRKGKP